MKRTYIIGGKKYNYVPNSMKNQEVWGTVIVNEIKFVNAAITPKAEKALDDMLRNLGTANDQTLKGIAEKIPLPKKEIDEKILIIDEYYLPRIYEKKSKEIKQLGNSLDSFLKYIF